MKLPIIGWKAKVQNKVTFLSHLTFEDESFRPFNLEVQFFEVESLPGSTSNGVLYPNTFLGRLLSFFESCSPHSGLRLRDSFFEVSTV